MSASTAAGVLIAGFGLGLSLIVAIGAQNAYVLRQGLRREHVGSIVAFCAFSDAALIVAGVAGMGALAERAPWVTESIRWAGAAFLMVYGALALRRALHPGVLATDQSPVPTRRRAIATIAALTWLNPHVYLDTLLLVGSVAATHGSQQWVFGAGAALASGAWFSALGFGATRLSGVFARPAAWRLLDLLIAVVMVTIAVSLVAGGV